MVELDVAGENDVAPRRLDDDTHAVGHGVRDAEEADRTSLPSLISFVLLDFADVDRRQVREFFLALLDHHAGELARVDRRVADAVDDIGDTADVIEVAVRDQESADLAHGALRDSRCWARCNRCPAYRLRRR